MMENGMRMNVSTSDFIKLYESNLSPKITYKTAYEKAEEQHQKITGNRRYSDYDTFRVIKSRRDKKRKR